MSDAIILSALQQATTAAVAASGTPTLPVKYIGVTFEPPSDQRYLECVFIPNNIVDQYWDRSRVYRGTFRLLMHWNIDGAGAYPPINALQSICAYFNKNTLLASNVRIYSEPDLGNIIENGPEIIWPASLEYRLFIPQ